MHLIGTTVGESLAFANDEPEGEYQSDIFKFFGAIHMGSIVSPSSLPFC
jgi:hypothetical protein